MRKKISSNYGNALLLLLNSIPKYLSISYKIWVENSNRRKEAKKKNEEVSLSKCVHITSIASSLLLLLLLRLISLNKICFFSLLLLLLPLFVLSTYRIPRLLFNARKIAKRLEFNSFFIINGMTSISSENCESCGAIETLWNYHMHVIMI